MQRMSFVAAARIIWLIVYDWIKVIRLLFLTAADWDASERRAFCLGVCAGTWYRK